MRTVPLTQGYVALVDDPDYERVNQFKWRVRIKNERTQYAVTGDGIRMHRFILGITDPKVQVDHDDRDGLNNQRYNLRTCTNGQNQVNKPKMRLSDTSQYKGVYWDKQRRAFRAKLVVRGRKIYCGTFTDERDAALAYDEAARKHFGDFAVCNFPPKFPCVNSAPASMISIEGSSA